MTTTILCWLAIVAYGVHILEEALLGWIEWAESLSGLRVSRTLFWLVNASALVLGVVVVLVGQQLPVLALSYFLLMLINAICFHIGAFVWKRGLFSPGLITAVFVFVPLGIWELKIAAAEGWLTTSVFLEALLLGALWMSVPLVIFRLTQRGGRRAL